MASWTRRASAGSLWITTSSEMGGPTSLMESVSHRMAEGTGKGLLTRCQGRLACGHTSSARSTPSEDAAPERRTPDYDRPRTRTMPPLSGERCSALLSLLDQGE